MIVFEKSGLINVSRRVYSHEIRQLFLTQNRGSRQTKNRETASEKLKFGCIFDKGKTFTNVKSLFLPLKAPSTCAERCALQLYQASLGKDQLHKFFHRFQPLISEINTEKHNFFFSEINTEKHSFSLEYDFSGRFERFFYIFIIGLRNAEC